MKKHLRTLTAVLALSLALGTAALAATDYVNLEAFTGVKLVLNGQAVTPVNSAGEEISTYAVDGATYVPLRFVAEHFGLKVGYDPATQTATVDKAADIDAYTTASTAMAFTDNALTGDELMDAINNRGGLTGVITTSPEGIPNMAALEYFMTKHEGKYVVVVHMITNQTSENLDAGSQAYIVYANSDNPHEDHKFIEGRKLAASGARMITKRIMDEELVEQLCNSMGKQKVPEVGHLYAFEVLETLPLG